MNQAIYSAVKAPLLLLLLSTLPLAAQAQSALTPEQLTIRVQRLSDSAEISSGNMDAIQQQLKNLSGEISRLDRVIDNRALLEMLQRVDLLSDEISQLNGALEEQAHDIDEIKKRQRELYLDVDRRLRDLENRATMKPSSAPASAVTPEPAASQTTTSSSSAAASTSANLPTLNASTPVIDTSSSNQQTSSVTQSEEKEAYQAAFDTLKEGRYKQAKTELKTFLDKYPDSSFAGNAQYWLGEAHYVTRNFDQGIVEFEKVLQQYSGSNKVPDAMLKLGYTFYELKQFERSKTILNDLQTRFGKTTAARLAGKRLDRIRKEGH